MGYMLLNWATDMYVSISGDKVSYVSRENRKLAAVFYCDPDIVVWSLGGEFQKAWGQDELICEENVLCGRTHTPQSEIIQPSRLNIFRWYVDTLFIVISVISTYVGGVFYLAAAYVRKDVGGMMWGACLVIAAYCIRSHKPYPGK